MSQEPVRYSDTLIFPAALDPDAVTVVNRLNEAGFESYFVGGCVRDLLLGLIPKDFDISTAARPRQIRRVFRNSRIIGRRFKLAHVHFGQNIIEVATFRRTPEGTGEPGVEPTSDDLLITHDNEFGTAEQDAVRRDFTINALLYDVRTAEVIDYVGGVPDLRARVLRTIGDPLVRFAEDPVRMLRAVKFLSRLGMRPSPELEAALAASADKIQLSAPPRVLEEIYKLMTCGQAGEALTRLLDHGLLQRLLPEVSGHWSQHRDELTATGAALDLIDRGRRVVSNAFLLATLCLQPWRQALADAPDADPLLRAHQLFDPAALRMSIPRRDATGMRQLLLTHLRLEGKRRGRRFRMRDFLARPSTEEGIQLLYLSARAGYADPETHADWVQRVAEAPADERLAGPHEPDAELGDDDLDWPSPTEEQSPAGPGGRRRRRRRGGRRHRNRRGHLAEAQGDGPSPAAGRERRPSPEAQVPFGPQRVAGGSLDGDALTDDGANESADPQRPQDGPPGGPEGSPRRRRRHRGGRRRRGRDRDKTAPTDGPVVDGPLPEAGQPAGPDAPTDAPSGAPEALPAAARQRGQGEGRAAQGQSQGRSERGGRGRSRRGGRGRRGEQGERGQRGQRGDSRAPRPASEPRETRDSEAQSPLSPARPSKAKAPAPGSRLAENPEDVEDLFDW